MQVELRALTQAGTQCSKVSEATPAQSLIMVGVSSELMYRAVLSETRDLLMQLFAEEVNNVYQPLALL